MVAARSYEPISSAMLRAKGTDSGRHMARTPHCVADNHTRAPGRTPGGSWQASARVSCGSPCLPGSRTTAALSDSGSEPKSAVVPPRSATGPATAWEVGDLLRAGPRGERPIPPPGGRPRAPWRSYSAGPGLRGGRTLGRPLGRPRPQADDGHASNGRAPRLVPRRALDRPETARLRRRALQADRGGGPMGRVAPRPRRSLAGEIEPGPGPARTRCSIPCERSARRCWVSGTSAGAPSIDRWSSAPPASC